MSTATLPEQLSPAAREFAAGPHRHLIAGERSDAADGRTFTTFDPSTGAAIAEVAQGGAADVEHRWTSEDEMTLNVTAMGQQVRTRLLVEESRIRLYLQLPGMLSFIRPAVEKALRARGAQLLEDKTT